MACSLKTQVRNRLVNNKLAEEVANELIISAPETVVMQESMKMAIDIARIDGVDGLPFNVRRGRVIMNQEVAEQVDRHRELVSQQPLEDVIEDELANEVLSSLRQTLRDFKIDESVTDRLRDSEGNILEGVAAADIINRSIQYLQGNVDRPTEEYIHFYVAALSVMDSPLYKSMTKRITGTKEYEEVLETHKGYEYDEQDMLDEAVTKRILNTLLRPETMDAAEQAREARWWKRAIAWLKEKLNLGDPYKRASLELLNKDLGAHAEALNKFDRKTIFRSAGNIQDRIKELIKDTEDRVEIQAFKKDYYEGKIDTKYLELFEDEEGLVARYFIDGVPIERRATDKSSIKFMWSVGGIEESKEISGRDRSKISSKTGTLLHDIMNDLIGVVALSKEFKDKFELISFDPIEKTTIDKLQQKSGISKEQFKRAVKTVTDVLNERAKDIPKGKKIHVYREIKLYSKEERTGGTVDLMFIDHEGFAYIYDYKFVFPRNNDVGLEKGEYLLRLDPFRGPKGEGHEDQMNFYVRTLKKLYNVSGVKVSRLIPGHVRMKYTKGMGITDKIDYFNMDATIDPELMHYPVANELPPEKAGKKTKELQDRRDDLKGRKRTEAVVRELNAIRTTLREIANVGAMVQTRKKLGELIKYAENGLKITDPENPEYLTTKDIVGLINALSIYRDMTAITGYKVKDLPEKQQNAFTTKMSNIAMFVSNTITALEEKGHERIYDDRFDLKAHSVPLSKMQWMTDVASVDNEYFKAAMYTYVRAQEQREDLYRALVEKWGAEGEISKGLNAWAERNGVSTRQAVSNFVKGTGMGLRLVNMFKPEFNEERKKMFAKAASGKDMDVLSAVKWMKDHYQVKEGAKEKYDKALETKEKELLRTYVTKTSYGYKSEIANFKANNDIFSGKNVSAWAHRSSLRFLEVKPEMAPNLYSSEYANLKKAENKELLRFYDEWKEQIAEFNDILDGRYINTNTVPSILIGAIEAGFEGKGAVKTFAKNMMHSITVEDENEEQIGNNTIKRVPLSHLKPILDDNGEFDESRVSMDLGRAMLMFGDAVYKHVALDDAEAKIQMIRILLENRRNVVMNGNKFQRDANYEVETTSETQGTLSEFDTMMDVLLYGNISKLELGSFKVNGKTISVSKFLNQMKTQYGRIKMTLPLKAAAGAAVSAIAFRRAKAVDNPNYSQEALIKGMELWYNDNAKYKALPKFFDVHAKDLRFESEQAMRGDILSKYMDSTYLYYPLIPADEMGDRRLLIAMLYTHGQDKDGKLKRLEDLPDGSKSLVELAELKDGKIEGISSETRFEMKMRFMEEVKGVRGNMSPYMFAMYESNVMFSIGMQFKGWMPEMLQDRFGTLKYNVWADRLMEGRYRSLGRQIVEGGKPVDENEVPVELQEMAWYEVMASATRSMKELLTMLVSVKGYTASKKRIEKLKAAGKWNEETDGKQAKATEKIYEEQLKILKENTTSPKLKAMDLEAFMQFQEQNITSAITELRYVFAWLLLTGLAGMAMGDEDDKMLNKGHVKLMDLMGRITMELAMFINPLEALYLNKSGIPLFGMLEMFGKMVANGADEISDAIMGENSTNDNTPAGYYAASFVYGTSNIRWLLK